MSDITLNCGFGCSSVDGCQGHCDAKAIEAQRAATVKQGAVVDESAVPTGCAQTLQPSGRNPE